MAGHQVNDRLLMHLGETVCANDKSVDMLTACQFECAVYVALGPHIKKLSLETQGARRRLCLFPFGGDSRIAHVVKQRDPREARNQLFEDFDPLGGQLCAKGNPPVTFPPGSAKLGTIAPGPPIVAMTTGMVPAAV